MSDAAAAEAARETLRQWARDRRLGEARLSEDGRRLALGDAELAADALVTVTHGGKSCHYTLASLFLQILDPAQGLLTYRNALRKHGVEDQVKPTEKPIVVGYFLGDAAVPAPAEAPVPVAAAALAPERTREAEKRDRSHKKRKEKHDKRGSSRDDKSKKKKKKEPKVVTDEQLLRNLTAVAGRRPDDAKVQQEEITRALSAEGFGITPELLAQYKPRTAEILAHEIPVGNSASILQAMNPNKSLARVLELFNETLNPKKPSSSARPGAAAAGKPGAPPQKTYLLGQKPVIVVPKGMTAPITLLNAHEFLAGGRFIPRDVMLKQTGVGSRGNPLTTFTRAFRGGTGGVANIEYEIVDNPKKLGTNLRDWERIVAVIVLGQGWQFKDWPAPYNDAVQLFSRTFGYYIGLEGSKVPPEVLGWSVTQAQLNRDKQGMDKVTYANFWNKLDEWMAVHKRELIPQRES